MDAHGIPQTSDPRKSSASGGGNCVEVYINAFHSIGADGSSQRETSVIVLDTKQTGDPERTRVLYRTSEWELFINAVKDDPLLFSELLPGDEVVLGEVGITVSSDGTVLMRNLHHVDRALHDFTGDEWTAFMTAVRAGEFDLERLQTELEVANR